jgi:4-hydroxybenzoate polyprenyltransferase
MDRINLYQVNFNRNKLEESPKSLILLLALAVIPVFWGSYSLNGWVIMLGVSFIGLCLMKVYEVDHKNIKLLCNTLIRCLKVLKGK